MHVTVAVSFLRRAGDGVAAETLPAVFGAGDGVAGRVAVVGAQGGGGAGAPVGEGADGAGGGEVGVAALVEPDVY